jgi:hypothetical protein
MSKQDDPQTEVAGKLYGVRLTTAVDLLASTGCSFMPYLPESPIVVDFMLSWR